MKRAIVFGAVLLLSGFGYASEQNKEEEQYRSPDGNEVLKITTIPPDALPEGNQRRTFSLVKGRKLKWSKTVVGEWTGPADVAWAPDSSYVAIADSVHGSGEDSLYAIDNSGRSPVVYHYDVDRLAHQLLQHLEGEESSVKTYHYKLWADRLSLSGRKVTATLWISARRFYRCPIGFKLGVSKLHSIEAPALSTFEEATRR